MMEESNGWSIEEEVYEYVLRLVPPPATLLELGSGDSTLRWAALGYTVVTVEHDENFIKPNTDKVTYIHAPIEFYSAEYPQLPSISKRINDHKGWYNRERLRAGLLGRTYDVIVVDGPTSNYGRSGFIANLNLFPVLDVPILFDDCHRLNDLYIAYRVAQTLSRDLLITNTGEKQIAQKPNGDWKAAGKKPFGVVLCQSTSRSIMPTPSPTDSTPTPT